MYEDPLRLLGDVTHRFQRRLRGSPVLNELGLAPVQAQLLAWISRTDHAQASAFAEATDRDKGQVARIVAQLHDMDLIARQPCESDGRVTLLVTTPRGDAACERLRATRQALVEEAVAGLSDADRATLRRLLTTMQENLS